MKCLNDLLNDTEDLENAISVISKSPYVELHKLKDYLQSARNDFSVLTLNVQSLNA